MENRNQARPNHRRGAAPGGSRPQNRENPWRNEGERRNPGRKRPPSKKKKSGGLIIIGVILALLLLVPIFFVGRAFVDSFRVRYVPTEERADLNWYFGLNSEEDLAVIIDSQVISGEASGTGGRIFDGEVYLDIAIVSREFNDRLYWDYNERLLIYTMPYGCIVVTPDTNEYTDHGEPRTESFDIIRQEGGTIFVALPFIQRVANIEYNVYSEPNRLVITSAWGEREVAYMNEDVFVRFQGGPQSPVLTEVSAGEEVIFIEVEGYWRKIATLDGFIGYVRGVELGEVRQVYINRDFEEPVFTQIVLDHPLNVGWDETSSIYDNAYVQETLNRSHGLTHIAPMWLSIRDTTGNIDSIATVEYVQTAHANGVGVWVTLRDFHGGINSFEETYQTLSFTSNRRRIIEQTIAETLRVGADGINLDFEKVPAEAGPHFVQFVRELSVECRKNGLVFSVANFFPYAWNLHYNLAEQARVVDYIILMGYDEYWDGSLSAGPVASMEFVRWGINAALEDVPPEMLLNALPFYSRLWYEIPKTEEEIAVGDGYTSHVTSVALGMDLSAITAIQGGTEFVWDSEAGMYYAQWQDPDGSFRWWLESMGLMLPLSPPAGGTYRIWLEDARSLREKLEFMRSRDLAGVSSWRLGLENASAWEVIGETFY